MRAKKKKRKAPLATKATRIRIIPNWSYNCCRSHKLCGDNPTPNRASPPNRHMLIGPIGQPACESILHYKHRQQTDAVVGAVINV